MECDHIHKIHYNNTIICADCANWYPETEKKKSNNVNESECQHENKSYVESILTCTDCGMAWMNEIETLLPPLWDNNGTHHNKSIYQRYKQFQKILDDLLGTPTDLKFDYELINDCRGMSIFEIRAHLKALKKPKLYPEMHRLYYISNNIEPPDNYIPYSKRKELLDFFFKMENDCNAHNLPKIPSLRFILKMALESCGLPQFANTLTTLGDQHNIKSTKIHNELILKIFMSNINEQ